MYGSACHSRMPNTSATAWMTRAGSLTRRELDQPDAVAVSRRSPTRRPRSRAGSCPSRRDRSGSGLGRRPGAVRSAGPRVRDRRSCSAGRAGCAPAAGCAGGRADRQMVATRARRPRRPSRREPTRSGPLRRAGLPGCPGRAGGSRRPAPHPAPVRGSSAVARIGGGPAGGDRPARTPASGRDGPLRRSARARGARGARRSRRRTGRHPPGAPRSARARPGGPGRGSRGTPIAQSAYRSSGSGSPTYIARAARRSARLSFASRTAASKAVASTHTSPVGARLTDPSRSTRAWRPPSPIGPRAARATRIAWWRLFAAASSGRSGQSCSINASRWSRWPGARARIRTSSPAFRRRHAAPGTGRSSTSTSKPPSTRTLTAGATDARRAHGIRLCHDPSMGERTPGATRRFSGPRAVAGKAEAGSRRNRPRCCPGEGVRRNGRFCHASRASITSAAPTTLTLPTHDLAAGAALTEQHRYPTPSGAVFQGF